MTRPTGKMMAPTSGWPVEPAPLKAKLVAKPSSAPDIMPRMSRSTGASASLRWAVSIIALATSVGLT